MAADRGGEDSEGRAPKLADEWWAASVERGGPTLQYGRRRYSGKRPCFTITTDATVILPLCRAFIRGLTVTEFNPDRADEQGELATIFVEGIADALPGEALHYVPNFAGEPQSQACLK